jgi:methyltransferase
VVAAEIAVLPLAFGLWAYALVFTVLNAAILFIRIRAENAALAGSTLPFMGRVDDAQRRTGGGV